MNPYIGTIDYADLFTLTLADIPGLIKGAHRNVGLGHRFLRHIERSKMLIYVIDLANEEPWQDLQILQHELETYRPGLTQKPSLIVGNKADLGDISRQNLVKLKSATTLPIIPISAKEKKNITLLTFYMRQMLERLV
jgi:GTP-binding protein